MDPSLSGSGHAASAGMNKPKPVIPSFEFAVHHGLLQETAGEGIVETRTLYQSIVKSWALRQSIVKPRWLHQSIDRPLMLQKSIARPRALHQGVFK